MIDDLPRQDRTSPLELLVVFFLLAIVLTAQLAMSSAWRLLDHPLWLDECFTQLIGSDPSFARSISAMRHGIDQSPPGMYVLLRPIFWMTGSLHPLALRLFAATMTLLAGAGLYGFCRRFFGRAASLVAVLALFAHPVVVNEMFEGRAYTSWLASTTWLCFFLSRVESRASIVGAIVSAVLGVTVHWFAILSVAITCVTDLVCRRKMIARRSLPFAGAILGFALCAPILLDQRRAITLGTWLPPINLTTVWHEWSRVFDLVALLVAAIGFLVWKSFDRSPSQAPAICWRQLAPILSLALIPVALIGVSLVVQPALLARYMIVATIPLSLLAALIAAQMTTPAGRAMRMLVLIVLIAAGARSLKRRTEITDSADAVIFSARVNVRWLMKYEPGVPIVCFRQLEFLPLASIDSKLLSVSAYCLIDSPAAPLLVRDRQFAQQAAAQLNHVYPQYHVVHDGELRWMRHFFIVAPTELEADVRSEFPGADVNLRAPDLFELRIR